MSYDLYLKPRSGEFSAREFLAYFAGRRDYVVREQQAWYENEDTGVYFSFEISLDESGADEASPEDEHPVLFNMNYFRPSFFALEAGPELTEVVRHFDFVVSDPQVDGMGDGEYDSEGFVRGWNKGNEFGYAAILRDPGNHAGLKTLPSEKLERVWAWNYARRALQAGLGDEIFVPKIMLIEGPQGAEACVVWTDGIPTAFPDCLDSVVVYLHELGPRKFFRRTELTTRVPWRDVGGLVEPLSERRDDAIVFTYASRPKAVVSYLRALGPPPGVLAGLSMDSVLDAELVEKHAS